MQKLFTLWIAKKIAPQAQEIILKELTEKYQLKIDEKLSNADKLVYTMNSDFDKKDFAELSKKLKFQNLKQETVNFINFAYDINDMGGKGKDNTTENQSAFATVKQMNELETKLMTVIETNQAKTDAKIDANHTESVANHTECIALINTIQAETNKRVDKLTEIVLKLVETLNGSSDKNS